MKKLLIIAILLLLTATFTSVPKEAEARCPYPTDFHIDTLIGTACGSSGCTNLYRRDFYHVEGAQTCFPTHTGSQYIYEDQ